MWQIETFETREKMLDWIEKNQNLVQYIEIFVNNGYAVEYRNLRFLDWSE